MTNPPYGQPPNDNNKGPWIIGGVIAAAVVLVLAVVLVAVNLGGSDEPSDGPVASVRVYPDDVEEPGDHVGHGRIARR